MRTVYRKSDYNIPAVDKSIKIIWERGFYSSLQLQGGHNSVLISLHKVKIALPLRTQCCLCLQLHHLLVILSCTLLWKNSVGTVNQVGCFLEHTSHGFRTWFQAEIKSDVVVLWRCCVHCTSLSTRNFQPLLSGEPIISSTLHMYHMGRRGRLGVGWVKKGSSLGLQRTSPFSLSKAFMLLDPMWICVTFNLGNFLKDLWIVTN